MEWLRRSRSIDVYELFIKQSSESYWLKAKKIELHSVHANMLCLPAMHGHPASRCVSSLGGANSRTIGHRRRPVNLVNLYILRNPPPNREVGAKDGQRNRRVRPDGDPWHVVTARISGAASGGVEDDGDRARKVTAIDPTPAGIAGVVPRPMTIASVSTRIGSVRTRIGADRLASGRRETNLHFGRGSMRSGLDPVQPSFNSKHKHRISDRHTTKGEPLHSHLNSEVDSTGR